MITNAIKKFIAIIIASSLFFISMVTPVNAKRDVYLSTEINTPEVFTSIAVKWDTTKITHNDYELNIRFKQKSTWTRWYHLESSIDHEDNEHHLDADSSIAESFFATNLSTAYQYQVTNFSTKKDLSSILTSIEFTPIHEKPAQDPAFDLLASLKTDVSESGLSIISRKQWGADESLRIYTPTTTGLTGDDAEDGNLKNGEDNYKEDKYADEQKMIRKIEYAESGEPLLWPLEYPEKIRKIFIHHTASSKNLDDPKQAIRDIYRWHAVGRGWGDIGYNYIIDQYGNIYEGRFGGESVIGGHVLGANTGSIGIAVMGNFQEEEVPLAAENSLIKLIAAKANLHDIAPLGESSFRGKMMDNIIGHRDFGATSCPGEKLYARLTEIRTQVYQLMGDISPSDKSTTTKTSSYAYRVASRPTSSIPVQKGEKFTFTIKLENTGSTTWRQGGAKRIAIVDPQNRVIGLLKEIEVNPGKTGTFTVTGTAPSTIGETNFKIKPIIGEDQSIDNTRVSIPLNVFDEPYKAKVIDITDDRVFRPNETKNIWIKLQNTGGKPWTGYSPSEFQLTQLVPDDVQILRISLFEEEVKPGEYGTVVITVKGPVKEGDYTMFFYTWFDGYGLTENRVHLPIKVSTDQSAKIYDPGTYTREDQKPAPTQTPDINTYSNVSTELIRVALSFRGNPTITGTGPFDIYEGNSKIAAFEDYAEVSVTKSANGYELKSGSRAFVSKTPPRFIPGLQTILEVKNFQNRPAWNPDLNDNKYRGVLEVYDDEGNLIVINELPLETYLRGLGEVSNDSEYEKIKALMVAARTYAKYYMTVGSKFPGKPYHLDDNPDVSQKYLGFGFETRSPKITQAVKETEGEVITYNGKLIKTPYFNQSDGRTRSAEEIWGWQDTPYLVSVPDTYCDSEKLLGHGVGLSGCGATGMARADKTYKEILKYFYKDTEVYKQ